MSLRILILASLITIAIAAPALATDSTGTSADSILKQQASIRADVMARAGRYKDLPEAKRAVLLQQQNIITARLQGVQSTLELSERERIAVFNALEAIEAIVNRAEDDRMICQRHKPAGSNRPTTICRTVAQRRADNEGAQSTFTSTRQCIDAYGSGFCKN